MFKDERKQKKSQCVTTIDYLHSHRVSIKNNLETYTRQETFYHYNRAWMKWNNAATELAQSTTQNKKLVDKNSYKKSEEMSSFLSQ